MPHIYSEPVRNINLKTVSAMLYLKRRCLDDIQWYTVRSIDKYRPRKDRDKYNSETNIIQNELEFCTLPQCILNETY